jgi:hypothetical protein
MGSKIQDGGDSIELEIHSKMNIITLKVMAHTIFGNNYKEAQQMFEQMKTFFHILMQAFKNPIFLVPRYRLFLPLLQISSRFIFIFPFV